MPQGLTTDQAKSLLTQHGQNVLAERKKDLFLVKLLKQFENYLTLLLILASLLSFVVGQTIDGSLILGIVILNALFGLYQEAKAEEAIAALRNMTVTKVRVIRDGTQVEIDSRYLVPQDVIFLEEGMKVPADGMLVEGRGLEINEAALTGESLSVAKEIHDSIFMGTIVAKGRGYIEIKQTGMKTKFGQIAQSLTQVQEPKTPLQTKLEDLTQTIGIIGILASLLVFGLSIMFGSSYFSSFLLAISLAVAIVPEGLPAVMTITLSIGVKEMARKKAIIRKLSAIEALGSVTLIATDKTGTLTTNKMEVKEVYMDNKVYEHDKLPPVDQSTFSLLLINGIVCSTASLVYIHDHGGFEVLGDPTEGALLILAQKLGLSYETVRNEWQIMAETPFDSSTRRMTVKVKKKNDVLTFTKGAPESIMAICSQIHQNGKTSAFTMERKQEVQQQLNQWGQKGLRILAFSYKPESHNEEIFLGMAALHDPPRIEAKEALRRTNVAGIKVVMITGDNEKTAEAIGMSIGLLKAGEEIVTGAQIDNYPDPELLKILPKVRIFARTSPFQKHRIVKLYQQLGEVVTVTGDGVNDAIALKQADVGIAMGLVGTDVARETADMILIDDNFTTIVAALEEGRNIIKNLKNAIKYLLSCNIAEAVTLITGLIMGIPNILYPIQLLYINLVTDGLPALSLSFAPRHAGSMNRAPEKKLSLLKRKELHYVFAVGIITAGLVLASLFIFTNAFGEQIGKTAAFSVLALIQSFILIDLWLDHRIVLKHLKVLNSLPFLIAFLFPFLSQFIIVSVPVVGELFKVTHVTVFQYGAFIFMAGLILVGIEVLKNFLD